MSTRWGQTDGGQSLNRRTVLKTVGGAVAGAAVATGASTPAAAGSYSRHHHDGRDYTKYVPDSVDGSTAVPLFVMLHGCSQTADDFKDETAMNQLADEHGFIVIYPEQPSSANQMSCWNWFEDQHTTRGNGEAGIIVGMVDEIKSQHNVDDSSVYVAGFSAGGGTAPCLAVEYADVFSGVAIHSGLEYDAANGMTDGTNQMSSCTNNSNSKGTDAYDAMESYGITQKIPTIVFHGGGDSTVSTCNGHAAAECFTQANDLAIDDDDDDQPDNNPESQTDGSGPDRTYTQSDYHDEDGQTIVRKIIVDGMGHAWSGGTQGGSYTDPGGPDASQMLYDFLHDGTTEPEPGLTASASASPTDPGTGDSVTFDGSGSTYTEGAIESFEWDFGDGSTASGETATHSYSSEGTYDVTLTVKAGGKTDTATVTVDVSNAPELYCGTASNSTHVSNGRAYESWGCYYAEGSGDYLGCMGSEDNTLEETSEGYFTTTSSCDGSGGGGDDGGDDGGSCWWCW